MKCVAYGYAILWLLGIVPCLSGMDVVNKDYFPSLTVLSAAAVAEHKVAFVHNEQERVSLPELPPRCSDLVSIFESSVNKKDEEAVVARQIEKMLAGLPVTGDDAIYHAQKATFYEKAAKMGRFEAFRHCLWQEDRGYKREMETFLESVRAGGPKSIDMYGRLCQADKNGSVETFLEENSDAFSCFASEWAAMPKRSEDLYKYRCKALKNAAKNGHVAIVDAFLKRRKEVYGTDRGDVTVYFQEALDEAFRCEDPVARCAMIKHFAVHARYLANQALCCVCGLCSDADEKSREMVVWLLANGADVSASLMGSGAYLPIRVTAEQGKLELYTMLTANDSELAKKARALVCCVSGLSFNPINDEKAHLFTLMNFILKQRHYNQQILNAALKKAKDIKDEEMRNQCAELLLEYGADPEVL